MKSLAGERFKISPADWRGTEHRGFGWGVHDDVSFQLVGDLLLIQLKKQRKRMERGEPKKPMFITHYTISNHEPYPSWPYWFEKSAKPDFSAMYEGEEHADRIERYMKVRYFTDMELNNFMDRMEKGGSLNDTIVVIVGDHGQAPEIDNCHLHEESVTRVPAAIIAEGRLGDAVGLVIDDAADQYDILNTLMDITGLPKGGFQQNGVGRSLKRKLPVGKRVVFSNDPLCRMAVVRGHERLKLFARCYVQQY
ncbi:sulfatase-like protein [Phytophthora infestans T30-4]|uniref:Sulfatase-like protein n=1 Tax=Phytophthora infestans (strain T30-4) TaxID=403677 RepID=D0NZA6_PHYIT|nr:sulfatase-like protein [Phytophthora infestans T30-4]EEY68915.1 sulfatase-like protein [Phytophthora infestans T30-4]|eukprot:XP_002997301.1 sulfatase-like protein [Phytophthora infestans T30-4]